MTHPKKRFLYVFKSRKNWGSSISEQAKIFSKHGHEILDLQNINIILANMKLIWGALNGYYQCILINHSINVYYLSPALLILPSQTCTILLAHEGEPLFRATAPKSLGSFLRRSKLYHRMASKITNHLVVLNKEQLSIYKKQGEVINFLGAEIVQGSDFPKQNLNNQKRRLMFASNSEIHGKGVTTFHKLQAQLRKHTQIDVFINKGMTHKALIAKMAQYDIIALTNDEYETYSLILIEAMILNKIIVASHKLGLIQNITAKYNPGELEDVGLFIFDHHSEFSEISHKLLRIHKAQTSEIYDKLALDHSSSAQRLIDYATRIQN